MTYEEALQYEERLYRRYFEPFDRLLEKKAQYYLNKEAQGNEIKPLLHEIEVLEQFREYVAMLETLLQDAIDGQHALCAQMEHLKEKHHRHLIQLSELYQSEFEQVQFFCQLLLDQSAKNQSLSGQCKQP